MSDTPALPVWKCDLKPSDEPGAQPLNNLTVGSKFKMSCHGDIPVEWDPKAPVDIVFKDPKSEAFSLAILKTEKLESIDAVFVVTGYRAGKISPEYIRFQQSSGGSGVNGFEVTKPEFEVRSVLKQGEQPKEFPPYGPWGIGLPLWFMIVVGCAVGLITFLVIRFVRRRSQRQKMLADLALHQTALSPANQFYKDARQLRKRLNNAKTSEEVKELTLQIDKEFRLFVLRKFLVPALVWSDHAIAEDIRKRHRKLFEIFGDKLRKALRETSRMRERKDVHVADGEQLQQICLDAVEAIGAVL